jgi:predicted RNA-binding Zn-ribbon protein involved in translation (DUF1610 family)
VTIRDEARIFDCPKCGCLVHVWRQATEASGWLLEWERVVICPNCKEELQVMAK